MSTDWQSFQIWQRLQQYLETVMTRMLHDSCESTIWVGNQGSTWITAIEIQETASELVLQIQMPQVNIEDLEIEVTQETAMIRGRQRQFDVEGCFQAGRFQSIIPFPMPTHPEAVRVEFQESVMRVVLPKLGTTQRQSVKVNLCYCPSATLPQDNQVEAY